MVATFSAVKKDKTARQLAEQLPSFLNQSQDMKKSEYGPSADRRRLLIKYLLMTKMVIVLVLFFSSQTFARTYGQGINLKLDKVQLKKILKSIEEQGYFRFVYKDQLLKGSQPVSIEVKNASLTEVLDI